MSLWSKPILGVEGVGEWSELFYCAVAQAYIRRFALTHVSLNNSQRSGRSVRTGLATFLKVRTKYEPCYRIYFVRRGYSSELTTG